MAVARKSRAGRMGGSSHAGLVTEGRIVGTAGAVNVLSSCVYTDQVTRLFCALSKSFVSSWLVKKPSGRVSGLSRNRTALCKISNVLSSKVRPVWMVLVI